MINGDNPKDFSSIIEVYKSCILTDVLAILFSSISVSFALLALLIKGIDLGFITTIIVSFFIIIFCSCNLVSLLKNGGNNYEI